jgi:PAS domain S-box-containing protein
MTQAGLVSWLRRRCAPDTVAAPDALSVLDCANSMLLDLDGRILGWSQLAEKTYGWPARDAVGQLCSTLLRSRYPEDFQALRDRLLHDAHWQGEIIHRRRDGAELVMSSLWVLQRNARGCPTAIIETDCEITHLRRSEEALHESQQMLRSVLDTIPVRVFWKDRNSVYLGCNALFAQDAGLTSPKELVGKTDFDMGFRAQAELYRADDQAVMSSGVPKLNYEEPQTTPDGRRLWLRTSKIPLRNLEGQITGVLGTYEDITEQKAAEEALRHSEATTRALLAAVPDLLFRASGDGVYLDYVATQSEMLAVPPEQFLGKRIFEVLPPGVAGALMDCTRRALSTGQVAICEYPLEVSGQRGWYEARVVGCGQNEVLHIVRDITTRRRTQEDLATSEERLRLALEAAQLGTWDWDLLSGKIEWSPRCREVFGVAPEAEISIQLLLDCAHPEDRTLVEAEIHRVLEPGSTGASALDYRVVHPDGAERWVSVKGQALFDRGAGIPYRFIGTVLDITERNEAEQRIRELSRFPDENPDPVMRVGKDCRLLYCNTSGQPVIRAWGCRTGELIPLELRRLVAAALESAQRVTEELQVGEKIFSFVFMPVVDSGYVNLYGLDITERKLAERELARHRERLEELVAERTEALRRSHEQLRRAERLAALGTLAAGIGHEINNPLNSIMMTAEYAMQFGQGNDIPEGFRNIIQETERCARIVRGLLQFARDERTAKEPGSLHTAIARAAELARSYLPTAGLSIKLELADHLPPVLMNILEIEQVLINLIRNASEATSGNVEVTIRTATAGPDVLLTVSDNGPGIASENLHCVFDPFFSTHQARGGTGLGLSITHGIITEHGGTITVQSPPGRGAIFTIRLPAQNAQG